MVSKSDHILMIGSCFSTEVGTRLMADGYNVCLNPFGILFNPASICNSLLRLESGINFTEKDVIHRCDDLSAGKFSYVSFSHHGSFARNTPQEFLINANESLDAAHRSFEQSTVIILTLGTAWVFRHLATGSVVANCHKIPAREFSREFLPSNTIVSSLSEIIARHREKRWIFTVSPVKHKADGEEGNFRSKTELVTAAKELCRLFPSTVNYFPSYEIVTEELTPDIAYRSDLAHPSETAVGIIYERFVTEKYL